MNPVRSTVIAATTIALLATGMFVRPLPLHAAPSAPPGQNGAAAPQEAMTSTISTLLQIHTPIQAVQNAAASGDRAGGKRSASLSGYVELILGHKDPGLASEPVSLHGTVSPTMMSAAWTISRTTMTDANGFYEFDDLPPGIYSLTEEVTGNYVEGPSLVGTLGGTACRDQIYDISVPAGAKGENYDFIEFPPASIGDFVWNDLNGNGIQDAGEPGLSGVSVNLLDSSGTVISTTTTDANGIYNFTSLRAGTYSEQFILPGSSWAFSPEHQGSDPSKDSDVDPATGTTAPIPLARGESNTSIDAGMVQYGCLGDFVWNDLNANGIQDAGEPGLSGVQVELLNAGGTTIAQTRTDSSGRYTFGKLLPGTYYIQVVAPGGYVFSTENQGTDPARDSDVDSAGKSGAIDISSGLMNSSIDAGLHP